MQSATIDELMVAEDPARWESFGFLVEDGACRLGGLTVRLHGRDAGHAITGWTLRGLQTTELDGLPTGRSEAPVRMPAAEHPNGVIAIDHVVAITPDLERTVAALRGAGLDLRRVREEPTPAGAPRQAFFRLGEEILEVVQEPTEVLERAGGRGRPAHFWGLAFKATEIERVAAAFGEHAGEIRPAVQRRRQIVTIRRSAGLAVPIAVMSEPVRAREPA